MTDQPVEQIPGQQALDEAVSAEDCGSHGSCGEDEAVTPDPTPNGADTSAVTPGESVPTEPDPTMGSAEHAGNTDVSSGTVGAMTAPGDSADTPDEHRFRIMHERSNAGDAAPHSTVTTEPKIADEAILWLAHHVHDLPAVVAALSELL